MVCCTHLKWNVVPSPFQADSNTFLWLVSHPSGGLAKSLSTGLGPSCPRVTSPPAWQFRLPLSSADLSAVLGEVLVSSRGPQFFSTPNHEPQYFSKTHIKHLFENSAWLPRSYSSCSKLNLVCGAPPSCLMRRVYRRKLSSPTSRAPRGPCPSFPSCAPAGPDTLLSGVPAQSLRTNLLLPFSWASAENSFCFTVGFLSTL